MAARAAATPDVPGAAAQASPLDCVICFARYDRLFKAPKALACGHTFCLECLSRLAAAAATPRCPLPCPLCRQPTVPPRRRGPPALPTRRDLLARLPPLPAGGSVRYSRARGLLYVVPAAGQVPTVTLSLEVARARGPVTTPARGGLRRALTLAAALLLAGALTFAGAFLLFLPAACPPAPNVTCAPATAPPPRVAGGSGDVVALGGPAAPPAVMGT